MRARIYQPAKNAMQSGRAGAGNGAWILECETETPRVPEPLMGWTASGDTLHQIRLRFQTREAAEKHARKLGWSYTLETPHSRIVRPRNYADNFRYRPVEEHAD